MSEEHTWVTADTVGAAVNLIQAGMSGNPQDLLVFAETLNSFDPEEYKWFIFSQAMLTINALALLQAVGDSVAEFLPEVGLDGDNLLKVTRPEDALQRIAVTVMDFIEREKNGENT